MRCDPWWENETEWHRAWKRQFPDDWQEKVQYAEDGERHVADVKTEQGWVLEFQHSRIEPSEHRSRDAFYPRLVWVVDGLRRKTDLKQFQRAWESAGMTTSRLMRRVSQEKCRLLQEWSASPGPVFLDFGGPNLVWLLGGEAERPLYVGVLGRAEFIKVHRGTGTEDFESFVVELHRRAGRAPMRHSPTRRRGRRL